MYTQCQLDEEMLAIKLFVVESVGGMEGWVKKSRNGLETTSPEASMMYQAGTSPLLCVT